MKVCYIFPVIQKMFGVQAYMHHLRLGLEKNGVEVDQRFIIGPKTERMGWQPMSLVGMPRAEDYDAFILTCTVINDKANVERIPEIMKVLQKYSGKLYVIVHCPQELKNYPLFQALHNSDIVFTIIFNSPTLIAHYKPMMPRPYTVALTPFMRTANVALKSITDKVKAFCPSRVYHCKHIEYILTHDPKVVPVTLCSPEIDRMYNYRVLRELYQPDGVYSWPWYRNDIAYNNLVATNVKKVFKEFNVLVNLTDFKDAGGYAEYCTLEAMDNGLWLILHENWTRNGGEMLDASMGVESANELKDALHLVKTEYIQSKAVELTMEYAKIFNNHDASKIALHLMRLFEGFEKPVTIKPRRGFVINRRD